MVLGSDWDEPLSADDLAGRQFTVKELRIYKEGPSVIEMNDLYGRFWRHADGTRARTFAVRQGADRLGVVLIELTDHQDSLLHDHRPQPPRKFEYTSEAEMRAEWVEIVSDPG